MRPPVAALVFKAAATGPGSSADDRSSATISIPQPACDFGSSGHKLDLVANNRDENRSDSRASQDLAFRGIAER
jgi:hypothetical protein